MEWELELVGKRRSRYEEGEAGEEEVDTHDIRSSQFLYQLDYRLKIAH